MTISPLYNNTVEKQCVRPIPCALAISLHLAPARSNGPAPSLTIVASITATHIDYSYMIIASRIPIEALMKFGGRVPFVNRTKHSGPGNQNTIDNVDYFLMEDVLWGPSVYANADEWN